MNPLDALSIIMLVGPVSFVLAQWGIPGFTWRMVWILTPILSWLVVNFGLWLDPPNNGTAYGVNMMFGWIYGLPVTGLLWLLQAATFRVIPSLPGSPLFQRACRMGADITLALAVGLFLFGTFDWISGDRAIETATRFLSRQGPLPQGLPHASRSWSKWTVRFGDESGPYVDVSRTGALIGGGGGTKPGPVAGSAENVRAQSEGNIPQREMALINAALAKHGVPGVSIAVIDHHQLIWAAGFGVRSKASPKSVDSNTVFQAASVSKPVCALAAMRLVENKKLQLDADVNLTLRSWQVPASPVAGGEAVTLRRLLSHSAGISVHGFPGYAAGEPVPTLLQVLQGRPPANSAPILIQKKPGTVWQYSGGGYCIVQELLVDLEQHPFDEIMTRLVLKPCGMSHSSYLQPLTGTLCDNQSAGHRADGSVIAGAAHVYPEQAAAGLWTTAADFARLLLSIDHAFTDAKPLFSKAMMKQIMTTQKDSYGLGWELGAYKGNPTLSHGGANEGFRCYVWSCPGFGKGLVVLTNSDNGSNLIGEIGEALIAR